MDMSVASSSLPRQSMKQVRKGQALSLSRCRAQTATEARTNQTGPDPSAKLQEVAPGQGAEGPKGRSLGGSP